MALFDLRERDFITTRDFTREELEYLIQISMDLKKAWYSGIRVKPLEGKAIGLLFKKPSTRTRNSFQSAIYRLGGFSVYMRPDELQLKRGEPLKDTARVLDRYYDALVIRTFGQEEIVEYAKYMKNPVVNALSDEEHPCQAMADLMTIKEKFGYWEGLKMVYTGDVWNVAHSLIATAPVFGMDLVLLFLPDTSLLRKYGSLASRKLLEGGQN